MTALCQRWFSTFGTTFSKTLGKVATPFSKKIPGVERVSQLLEIKSRQGPSYNGSLDSFAQDVKDYDKRGYQIIIACATEERIRNLRELLQREGLGDRVSFKLDHLKSSFPILIQWFFLPDLKGYIVCLMQKYWLQMTGTIYWNIYSVPPSLAGKQYE